MPTEAKREMIEDLRAQLGANSTMIVSEYRGLKVKEIGEIRRALRKQNVSYRVVKNRLMRIAAQDNPASDALSPLLVGPTAIAFGTDEAGTAKAVTRLAALPSRDTLLAEAIGAIAAPMSTMAGLLDAPLRDVAGLISALHDKRADAAA